MMDCLGTNTDDDYENRSLSRRGGKCMCFKDQPYRKLEDPDPSEEETMKIMFYANETDVEGALIEVEKDLCTVDLCQLLTIKLGLSSGNFWSIVEYWVNKDIERVLEDHEYMLAAYNDMKRFVNMDHVRYIYRQVIGKYDFLREPVRCFRDFQVIVEDRKYFRRSQDSYLEFMLDNDRCPTLFAAVLHKQDGRWHKVYLLLREGKVYMTRDEKNMHKLIALVDAKRKRGGFVSMREVTDDDLAGLTLIAHLSEYQIYRVRKKTSSTFAVPDPDATAFVLRPSVGTDASASDKILYRFSCFSENIRLSWISAMRLAKYGKQIRENYRAFRNKQNDMNSKDFSSFSVPNREDQDHRAYLDFSRTSDDESVKQMERGAFEIAGATEKVVPSTKKERPVSPVPQFTALERESVRSRVAMDFTGKQGRIVEDPVEANEIALAEGYMWKRRHKITSRRPINSKPNENHVDVGIHTMQPWFHSNLSRDQASSLVSRYGDGDGVFIVRPSRTSEGTFVLTYKCQGKLIHQQIIPMTDRERNITVFTLDNGQTKFYDILQLVEFYTVNLGPLMCRLTHYITENANIHNPSIPSSSNTPEYVNVAVNTDISIIVNSENANILESSSGSSKTTSPRSLGSRCSPN